MFSNRSGSHNPFVFVLPPPPEKKKQETVGLDRARSDSLLPLLCHPGFRPTMRRFPIQKGRSTLLSLIFVSFNSVCWSLDLGRRKFICTGATRGECLRLYSDAALETGYARYSAPLTD